MSLQGPRRDCEPLARKLTRLATFAQRETRADLERNLVDELANNFDVVTRHDHLLVGVLRLGRERQPDRHVARADEQLRAVVVHEGSVATSFFFRQDVARGGEFARRLDSAGEGQDHAALDLLALDAAQQGTHVVSCLATVELLVEHLNAYAQSPESALAIMTGLVRTLLTSQSRLECRAHADNLDLRSLGDRSTLNTTRDDRSTTLN